MKFRADLSKEGLKENQSLAQPSSADVRPTVAVPSTPGTEKCISRSPKRSQRINSQERSSIASASIFLDFVSKKHNLKRFNVSLHKSPMGSRDTLDVDGDTSQASFAL